MSTSSWSSLVVRRAFSLRLPRPAVRVPRRIAVLVATAVLAGGAAAGAPLLADPASSTAPAARAAGTSTIPTPSPLGADDALDLLASGTVDVLPDPTDDAIAAVQEAGGVPLADGTPCAADALRTSYDDPGEGWSAGAHVAPLVAPDGVTTSISGIVLCDGSHAGYVGFTAVFDDGGWHVELVPDPTGGLGDVDEHAANATGSDPAVGKPPVTVTPGAKLVGLVDGPDIEGYARYEAQATCDPTAKPGTVALRDLLLARYDVSRSLGITRACSVGGRSEHKEGRAFDWGVNVNVSAQKAAAEAFIADLLATDAYGHPHALVRRMGIMYIIWNGRIWSAYQAGAGWRTYSGSSPHTDHVHLSLSWAGARGQTSFWSGTVVPGLPDRPLASGGSSSSSSTPTRTTRTARPTVTSVRPPTTPTSVRRWRDRPVTDALPSTTTVLRRPTTSTTWRPRSTTTTALRASTTTTPTTIVRRWPTTTTAPVSTSTTVRSTTTSTSTTLVRRWTTTTAPPATTTTVRSTTTTAAPPATTTVAG